MAKLLRSPKGAKTRPSVAAPGGEKSPAGSRRPSYAEDGSGAPPLLTPAGRGAARPSLRPSEVKAERARLKAKEEYEFNKKVEDFETRKFEARDNLKKLPKMVKKAVRRWTTDLGILATEKVDFSKSSMLEVAGGTSVGNGGVVGNEAEDAGGAEEGEEGGAALAEEGASPHSEVVSDGGEGEENGRGNDEENGGVPVVQLPPVIKVMAAEAR